MCSARIGRPSPHSHDITAGAWAGADKGKRLVDCKVEGALRQRVTLELSGQL